MCARSGTALAAGWWRCQNVVALAWRGPRASALSLLCLAGITGTGVADDAKWGTVTGRIVLSGEEIPKSVVLDIERDAEVCGKSGLVDESLVVNADNRGIAHIAIWLDAPGTVIHPDLIAISDKHPTLDNAGCRFVPRMQALRTGELLLLRNSDPVAHNAAIGVRRNTPSNVVIATGAPAEERSFPKPETQPARVDCSIHAWMRAWLIITDHPYVAVTDADGRFELKNLPAGEHKFRFWHERPKFLKSVQHDGKTVAIEKGIWNLTVPSDSTLDLGEVTITAETFETTK